VIGAFLFFLRIFFDTSTHREPILRGGAERLPGTQNRRRKPRLVDRPRKCWVSRHTNPTRAITGASLELAGIQLHARLRGPSFQLPTAFRVENPERQYATPRRPADGSARSCGRNRTSAPTARLGSQAGRAQKSSADPATGKNSPVGDLLCIRRGCAIGRDLDLVIDHITTAAEVEIGVVRQVHGSGRVRRRGIVEA